MSAIQCCKFFFDEGKFDTQPISNDARNCLSSAQKWQPIPYHLATIPRGRGTPQDMRRISKRLPWIDNLWGRPFKYDRNHSGTLPDKPKQISNRKKEHNGQLCQMQQTGPEGTVPLLYFDQSTIRSVLVLWRVRYADSRDSASLLSKRYLFSRIATALSMFLGKVDNLFRTLQCTLCLFIRGFTGAAFTDSGNTTKDNKVLIGWW